MTIQEKTQPAPTEEDFGAPKPVRLGTRTREEIEETRRRIFALSRPPRPLPPGKTLEDVIVGQWPGDETDEEIQAILDDLS